MLKEQKPVFDGNITLVYSGAYYVDMGDHVFPTSKYRLLWERLKADKDLFPCIELAEPYEMIVDDLYLVHTREYVGKLLSDTLSPEEKARTELPVSPRLVKAYFTCCGGTYTALVRACENHASVHLGGGFHHAFPDHGEGFCLLNDIAVAVRMAQERGLIRKALVIDCDLHQGNGTALIFRDDPAVFTFSMHQENNYPFKKQASDMDIGLKDLTGDKIYIDCLRNNIPHILSSFSPDIILYVAGADPFTDDRLGNLSLTKEGLRQRDSFIFECARNFGVPVAVTLAGGYAVNREDTVDIHYATIEECAGTYVKEYHAV